MNECFEGGEPVGKCWGDITAMSSDDMRAPSTTICVSHNDAAVQSVSVSTLVSNNL